MKQGGAQYGPNQRQEIASLLPTGAVRLLDIGCNDGSFGQYVKSIRPGSFVVGMEADAGQSAVASSRLDLVVNDYFPEGIDKVKELFEVVSFNHVIEHLPDPWGALKKCREVLLPNGIIVGQVPNIRYMMPVWDLVARGRWRYTDTGILDRTHLRFYTRSGLVDLLSESGYIATALFGSNAVGSRRYPRASRIAASVGRDFAYGSFTFSATPEW